MPTVELSEVADFVTGGTPSRKVPEYYSGDIPWITGADIVADGAIVSSARSHITPEAVRNSATNVVETGTVLLVTRTSVGKVGVTGVPLAINQDITAVRPDPARLDRNYLVRCLQHQARRFEDRAQGATIQGVNRSVVAETPVPLPPLCEQRRIAAVLDAADALRAKRREALAKLDTLTQAIFIDMFGNSTASRIELCAVAEVQGGLQVTSKRRNLPREVPYLRVANVHRGRLNLDEVKTLRVTDRELERTQLSKGDLLVVEGHGNKDEIGRVARWDGRVEPCVHQNHLIRARCDPTRALSRYVEAFMNSDSGRQCLLAAANTTSGLNTISTGDVRAVQLPVPPLHEQQRFSDVMDRVDKQRDALITSQTALNTLFASLQQRALRGEL